MKKLITILTVLTLAFTVKAQEALFIIELGSTDTIVVMESDIYKVTNVTDSTSTVEYMFKGVKGSTPSDTTAAEFVVRGTRIFIPTGLGYAINADNIQGITRLSSTTCWIWYLKGNAKKRLPEGSTPLQISATTLMGLINAL